MPGVQVTTSLKSGPSTPLKSASGQFFVTGLAERGPTDEAVLVRGLADFQAVFGPRPPYGFLYDTIKTFFDEGGEQAYVVRTVGQDATRGTVVLKDRQTPTPADTLVINAASPGAWSGQVSVRVSPGAIDNTVKIEVLLGQDVVETQNNIATPQQAVQKFRLSPFIDVVDSGSTAPAPSNLPAVGTFAVSAGDDMRGTITPDRYVTSLDKFIEGLGDGAVAIPGVGPAVHAGLAAHARKNRRVALLSHNDSASLAELNTAVGSINTDAAGLFEPWLQITDGAGGVRNTPPEGFVAACRARAHNTVGAWRAPAGGIGQAQTLLGLAREYTKAEAEALDDARVNVIRRVAGTVRLYGWRSLSSDEENYAFLSARDLLNRLVVESEARLEQFVFQPIDAKNHLLSSMNAELTGIVEPIRQAGGLYEQVDANGEAVDPGYLVETGSTVNSTASLAKNEVRARLSVRLSPTGAMVMLDIVKVGLLSGL